MKKTLAFWAAILLVVAVALEAFSFVGVQLFAYARPHYFRQQFLDNHFDDMTEDDLRKFKDASYDPLLGWDNQPNTSNSIVNTAGRLVSESYGGDGARHDGLPGKANLISTYGDSFTACVEVADRESWQFFLEQDLGYEVKNFGVAAYGTDQAVLKFEADVAQGDVLPIAMLGLFEENINRILSRFRPFYEPGSDVKFGFKPSFIFENDRLVFEPNLLTPAVGSVSEAKGLAEGLIDTDYWAGFHLQNRFPFILQIRSMLRIAWEEAARLRRIYHHWRDDDAVRLMSAIVDRFIAAAEAARVYPVVVLIPDVRLWRNGRREPGYGSFKRDLRRRHSALLVIDIAEHEFREDLFNVLPFRGHASAYGNSEIARILAEALRTDRWFRQITERISNAEGARGRRSANDRKKPRRALIRRDSGQGHPWAELK